MKKKTLVISAISIILIIAGGALFMKYQNDKQKEQAFWDEQKPRIELFFKYNFNDITSVTFDDDSQVVNPTGVPHMSGYLNGDKSLWFDASVGNGQQFESASYPKEVAAYIKKEYRVSPKKVSEIEAEENSK
ncbi:DUF1433 domain-containing protein [Listeria booriae]|uniref:DUF1433 domain-containing protein n=1 Tax=Listeria booriae TaxID=1552123 RepID=UPI001628FE79|nr:DUF1433 domain-containing protein [Listeria booriae]MBC1920350.1 DUF1433 domain-containing protein [Listeria booriae]